MASSQDWQSFCTPRGQSLLFFPGCVDVPQLDKWLTHKRARMQNNKTTTTDTGWSYSGLHRNMRLFVLMALIHALLLNTARVNNSTEIL